MAQPPRRSRVSIVWLVPIVALVIGAWLAWHALAQRGPTITILFLDSEGIEAGKTKIKYKNVDVGTVSAVQLTHDRKQVRVTAQLQPETADWLVKDTRFWVVRPRVGAGGVSGLGTLFSGAYIGMDFGKSTEDEREFTGMAIPPVLTDGMQGRQFTLQTDVLGSLDRGTLVFFRRIPVGQVIAYQLNPGGSGVEVQVFVEAPYDQLVTRNARFWHASGIDVDLSASGLSIRTESLASIIAGGIAFQAAPDEPPSPPADAGTVFKLFGAATRPSRRTPDASNATSCTSPNRSAGSCRARRSSFAAFPSGRCATSAPSTTSTTSASASGWRSTSIRSAWNRRAGSWRTGARCPRTGTRRWTCCSRRACARSCAPATS